MSEDITELYEIIDTLTYQLAQCRKRNKKYLQQIARLKEKLGEEILEDNDEES